MNRKMIGKMLGFLLLLDCLFLLPPALISVWDGEREALRALFTTMALSAGAGALLWGGAETRNEVFMPGRDSLSYPWAGYCFPLWERCPSGCPERSPTMWTPFLR